MTYDDKVRTLLTTLINLELTKLNTEQKVQIYNVISNYIANLVPFNHPSLNVKLVRNEKLLLDNAYKPNNVASPEYKLLRNSIIKDGITMPIITGRLCASQNLAIIDGYHRNQLIKTDPDIHESLQGYAPIITLEKTLDQRLYSSIRHNLARGIHQESTAQLMMKLKALNWSKEDISQELGADCDEILGMQKTDLTK
ncbi:ParB N-terminal domain-containing protein [Vibrio hyugaensis]|uniref:ParB N-terminal domain-containing protein n=1 Tax=Vibrio hyugaensis TaxID=1534743 RepID=UPI000CE3736E|nr:ParB N-terminal domain-containing protein [Vibrio hyugaensis]